MNACSPAPRTAMILAAGLGTRLRPLTDWMPKALVPFEGVPMIQRLMVRLREAGFTRAVINVHHFADMLEDFVRSHGGFGLEVEFSDERDLLRDTGGGIRHAVMSGLIGDKPVLVHNVDIVTSGIDLGRFFRETSGIPDASLLVSDRRASRYLLADSDGMLRGWVHPAKGIFKSTGSASRTPVQGPVPADPYAIPGCTPLAFSGIHILTPAALQLLRSWPEAFSIIDFYLTIAATHPVHCISAPPDAAITDIGKLSLLQ